MTRLPPQHPPRNPFVIPPTLAVINPIFLTSVGKVNGKDVKLDWDRSGMGWRVEHRTEGKDTILPTTCKMERPPMQ